MGGRRARKAGLPRMRGRQDGGDGRRSRRVEAARAAEDALANSLRQVDAGRVAALAVSLRFRRCGPPPRAPPCGQIPRVRLPLGGDREVRRWLGDVTALDAVIRSGKGA